MSNFSIITWSEHERKKVAQFSKTKSPGQLMTIRAINMRTGPYLQGLEVEMETMVKVVTGVIVIIIKLHNLGPTKGLHIKCFLYS